MAIERAPRSPPVSRRHAQHESVTGRPRAVRIAIALAALAVAACSSQFVAPVPPAYAERVESARQSLEENWDGPPRPTFAFVGLRCRADGGLLVTFAQLGARDDGSFAYAFQGPDSMFDSWGGGFGQTDLDDDPEIDFFFREVAEVPCPPEPAT
jgi:hypothetical protein